MEGIKEIRLDGYSSIIPYENTHKILEQMNKYICKIKIGKEQGTGFFCKIPFPNEDTMIPVFITNNHVINEELLYKQNKDIEIYLREENKKKIINLKNRIIYTNKSYDTTIIEIKEEDEIKKYLELDDKIINDIIYNDNKNFDYIDDEVYTIQYPNGKLSVSYGIIETIYDDKKYSFKHKCSTESGSSGAPILKIYNNKIIGIHKEGLQLSNYKTNLGTFLNYPIKEFIKINCNKIDGKNLLNSKMENNIIINETPNIKTDIKTFEVNNYNSEPIPGNNEIKISNYSKNNNNMEKITQYFCSKCKNPTNGTGVAFCKNCFINEIINECYSSFIQSFDQQDIPEKLINGNITIINFKNEKFNLNLDPALVVYNKNFPGENLNRKTIIFELKKRICIACRNDLHNKNFIE